MMKKIIFMGFVITFLIVASFVKADQVNMNISVNGTSNLNITVNADDSAARAAISQTQNDVYGTTTASGPRDMILDEIARGYGNPVNISNDSQIKDICSDSYLQQYLGQVSVLPPIDFINYLKGLGYDDEDHISFIWNICQQDYINQHQGQWSQDLVGGGIQQGDLVSIFQAAIDWLNGKGDSVYSQAKNLGMVLDSYFASKRDVWILLNKINQLEIRVEALERTMENISADAYCQGKLEVMNEYNLTGVKCGANSTLYWNAKKAGFDNYDTIAYRTCDEDWACTSWSDCINGIQSRKCVDKNDCGSFDSRPSESRNCIALEQKEVKSTIAEKPKIETLTKQVLSNNYLSKNNLSILIVTVALISLALGFYKNPKIKLR